MSDENIWQIVAEICRDEELSKNKLDSLRDRLSPWEPSVIQKRLESAGVIPEMYDHDSAEYLKKIRHLANDQIKFWEDRIANIRFMDREKLIDQVIAAEVINGKIQILRKYLA